MKKNNLWNRIFHSKTIKNNKQQYTIYLNQVARAKYYVHLIKETKDLLSLLELHKSIYNNDFCESGPNPYGMFRCESILAMTPEDVYLGGIWGLTTNNISFWESKKTELYGSNEFGIKENTLLYDLVLEQYKRCLINGITSVYNKAQSKIPTYEVYGY